MESFDKLRSLHESISGIINHSENVNLLREYVESNIDEIAEAFLDICDTLECSPDDLTETSFDDLLDLIVGDMLSEEVRTPKTLSWKPRPASWDNLPTGMAPNPKRAANYDASPAAEKPSNAISAVTKSRIKTKMLHGNVARKQVLDKLKSAGFDMSKITNTHSIHFRKHPNGRHDIILHDKSQGRFRRYNPNGLKGNSFVIGHLDHSESDGVKSFSDPTIYRGEKSDAGKFIGKLGL